MRDQPEQELPGPPPLTFRRQNSSFAHRRDVGLGYGWVHSLSWDVEGEVRATGLKVWSGPIAT